MTFTSSEANAYAPSDTLSEPKETPIAPIKRIWSTVSERFWGYTAETSETSTESFKGLL